MITIFHGFQVFENHNLGSWGVLVEGGGVKQCVYLSVHGEIKNKLGGSQED